MSKDRDISVSKRLIVGKSNNECYYYRLYLFFTKKRSVINVYVGVALHCIILLVILTVFCFVYILVKESAKTNYHHTDM